MVVDVYLVAVGRSAARGVVGEIVALDACALRDGLAGPFLQVRFQRCVEDILRNRVDGWARRIACGLPLGSDQLVVLPRGAGELGGPTAGGPLCPAVGGLAAGCPVARLSPRCEILGGGALWRALRG